MPYPIPNDNYSSAGLATQLQWEGTDPDSSTPYMLYDIYFGLNPDLPKVDSNFSTFVFNPRWIPL